MCGLFCGFVFAYEEYQRRDGDIAEAIHIKFPKSYDDICDGNFKVPDTKRLDTMLGKALKAILDDKDDDFGGEPVDPDDSTAIFSR